MPSVGCDARTALSYAVGLGDKPWIDLVRMTLGRERSADAGHIDAFFTVRIIDERELAGSVHARSCEPMRTAGETYA